jgi:hypothetical protein
MKKLIQVLIVCLVCVIFVGCGEKLSPGAEICMKSVNEMKAGNTKGMGKKLEYLTQACKDYKGDASEENTGIYMMKKMTQKCKDEGVSESACFGNSEIHGYWSPDN